MPSIKISPEEERADCKALQAIVTESHQSISGLLAETIGDSVRKRRLRPALMEHLKDSLQENYELGRRLAR
jgi:hypothetical protein